MKSLFLKPEAIPGECSSMRWTYGAFLVFGSHETKTPTPSNPTLVWRECFRNKEGWSRITSSDEKDLPVLRLDETTFPSDFRKIQNKKHEKIF